MNKIMRGNVVLKMDEKIISTDKVYFDCETCGKEIISQYSNYKIRKHMLCLSCTRRKTVSAVHKARTQEEKDKINKNISIKTKEAVGRISMDERKNIIRKMVSSMNWEKRNSKWKKTMKNKTQDEKKEINAKISKTLMNKSIIEKRNIRNKVEKTWLRKYGVNHISKNKLILEKQMKNRSGVWKLKQYESKFGIINYQTKPELNYIQHCEANDINIWDGPSIPYTIHDTVHLYRIDFETQQHLIEIKSSHQWYYKDLESGKIDAKNKAAQDYAASINKTFLFLLDEF